MLLKMVYTCRSRFVLILKRCISQKFIFMRKYMHNTDPRFSVGNNYPCLEEMSLFINGNYTRD